MPRVCAAPGTGAPVSALTVVLVFLAAVALDFADTCNTRAVGEGRAHAAAAWSVTMYALGCVGLYSVVAVSWWLVIPEALGLYVGSVAAVTILDSKARALQTDPEEARDDQSDLSRGGEDRVPSV